MHTPARRLTRSLLPTLALAALSPTGCQSPGPRAPTETHTAATLAAPRDPISHMVFFRLTDPADAHALIADSRASLSTIPGVQSLFCGTHLDTGRASVVSDYDVCICVGFATPQAYADYLSHPSHQALVARWKDRFASARIFDAHDDPHDDPHHDPHDDAGD